MGTLTPLKENWGQQPTLTAGNLSPVLPRLSGGSQICGGSPYPKFGCYRPSMSLLSPVNCRHYVPQFGLSSFNRTGLSEADEVNYGDGDSGIANVSPGSTDPRVSDENHMDVSCNSSSTGPFSAAEISPLLPPNKKFRRMNLSGDSASYSPMQHCHEIGRSSTAVASVDPITYRHRQSSSKVSIEKSFAGSSPLKSLMLKRLPNYRNPFVPTDPGCLTPPVDIDDCWSLDEDKPARLWEVNQRNYAEEFVELRQLGSGRFGSTYSARNRIDGRTYCIKKLSLPFSCGLGLQRRLLREVYSLAAFGGEQPNLVRYFSAWAEPGCMYIQTELCSGGSLQQLTDNGRLLNNDIELLRMLLHIARGLGYLHEEALLAHLDVKPANVLVVPSRVVASVFTSDSVSLRNALFKLADFGHITSPNDDEVIEGDSRFMAQDLLSSDFVSNSIVCLARADMFSLGLTAFAAATGLELPKNGQDWLSIRTIGLPFVPSLGVKVNSLLRSIGNPDPATRLTAKQVCSSVATVLSKVDNGCGITLSVQRPAAAITSSNSESVVGFRKWKSGNL